MNYCLIDTIGTGHHWTYNKLVVESIVNGGNNNVFCLSGDKLSELQKKVLEDMNVIFSEFNYNDKQISNWGKLIQYRAGILKEIFEYCIANKIDRVLFLYADGLMSALAVTRFIHTPFEIYYFVHWLPVRARNRVLFSISKCKSIFVHTEYIKEKMPTCIKKKVKVLPYPISDIKQEQKNIILSSHNRILCFGGTRKDKGVDILLEALKNINMDVTLSICGAESYFKKEFIEKELRCCSHVVQSRIQLRFVTDDEMEKEYMDADIVVLPYRRTFRGESGVLLEAINHKKVVIAPDILHFREYIEECNCGRVFEAENVEDLKCKLEDCISDYANILLRADFNGFRCRHSSSNFKKELYSELRN